MAITEVETIEETRRGLTRLNKLVVLGWRLGLADFLRIGKKLSPNKMPQMLVMTHAESSSGKAFRTALFYTEQGGDIYVLAGLGEASDWFKDILRNPQVELWMNEGWWTGVAEDVTNAPNALALLRQLLLDNPLAAKESGLDIETASEPVLKEYLKSVRVAHIRRVAPRTGTDGPGDLAWIWPLTTILLVVSRLFSRRRGCWLRK